MCEENAQASKSGIKTYLRISLTDFAGLLMPIMCGGPKGTILVAYLISVQRNACVCIPDNIYLSSGEIMGL